MAVSKKAKKGAAKGKAKRPASRSRGVDIDTLRELAMALPGAEEGTSYGTLAFRVQKKFFVRLREDGESLVVRVPPMDQEFLLLANPEVFFLTDHYRGYPVVLVHLSRVSRATLKERLEEAWRTQATKRLLAEFAARPAAAR